jgi:pimeloyl-ACP methyl ester carboxylesterase
VSKGGVLLPAALGVVLATLVAAPAQAAFSKCGLVPGAQCATVSVPLDHEGVADGRVGLHVVRLKARRPSGRALVYLSGGPGGTGTMEFVAALADQPIRALRSGYDLATFDQRGTGRSGLLRCRALERDPRLRSTAAGAGCAATAGPRRAFYTTRSTVEDLEAVRRELGASKLLLYGVSYGTKVALAYARAYPDRVERLLLDSVVDPDDTDAFGMEPYRSLQATLLGLCPDGCGGVTTDPVGDLAALTERLRARPITGLTPLMISDLLFDADYAPELRTGVPAAVRSLLDHDNPAPLRRLIAAAGPLAAPGSPREFSSGRYATVCEETPLPWPRDAPIERRMYEARTRAAALGPDAFRPFDFDVLRADEIDLCLKWPTASAEPVLRGAGYPGVPALLLQGGEDLRTPPSTSLRVARGLAGSQRLVVPGVGHAVLGSDPSGCAVRALRRWLAGDAIAARCKRVATQVPAAPLIPRTLAQVPPARGLSGAMGRTVGGLSLTLEDLGFLLSPALSISPYYRGLAGGGVSLRRRTLRLNRFAAVRGLWIEGSITGRGTLRARVGGSGARHGHITVSPGGRLTGRLGGMRVRATLEAGGRTRATVVHASRSRAAARLAAVAPAPRP